MKAIVPGSIDEYIADFPLQTQNILRQIRAVIRENAPGSREVISYRMPTFKLHGNLVHFAAYPNHIGLYPAASGTLKFAEALRKYKSGKGSVQFPLNEPIPYELISEIVRFRVAEQNMLKGSK